MSNNDGHTKTLRFSDALDEKFGKLAQKLRHSKLQLFGLMVDYFHKTGKDPADISDEVLKTRLNLLLKRKQIGIKKAHQQPDLLLRCKVSSWFYSL
jgi:hypothetical protein